MHEFKAILGKLNEWIMRIKLLNAYVIFEKLLLVFFVVVPIENTQGNF